MNDKFFQLSEKKQHKILNAGYRVFSRNSYKKCPVSEIADNAGISKSLLFYYFRNKRELYLYLLEKGAKITVDYLNKFKCYDGEDFFDIMHRGLKAKVALMRKYPNLAAFVMKAYYETDSEVKGSIMKIIAKYGSYEVNAELLKLNKDKFVEGLDLEMMYHEMYWAGEGYLWNKMQSGRLDPDEMERDFGRLIDFWKSVYYRKEGEK